MTTHLYHINMNNGLLRLWVIISLLFPNNLFSQKYFFDHLTTNEGLSQNCVYTILQDRDGFMWFGTQAGLDRFDGIEFYPLSGMYGKPNTISEGFVKALYEDRKKGFLWVGSEGGISQITLPKDQKTSNYIIKRFLNNIVEPNIISIKGDTEGNVFATSRRNLFYHRANNDTFIQISNWGKSHIKAKPIEIKDLILFNTASSGLLSTNSGIFLLNYAHGITLTPVKFSSDLLNDSTHTIVQSDSLLYFGTKSGVYAIDKSIFDHLPETNLRGRRLENTEGINCKKLLLTDSNTLWLGTEYNGVVKYSLRSKRKDKIERNFGIPKSLSNEYIASLFQSQDKNIWIGTLGGGVDKFTQNKPVFRDYYYLIRSDFKHDNNVWAIEPIDSETLLLGTQGNGLVKYSTASFSMQRYMVNSAVDEANYIRGIQSLHDTLLLGTQNGLYYCKKKSLDNKTKFKTYAVEDIPPNCKINTLKVAGENIFIGGKNSNGNVVYILNRKLKDRKKFEDSANGEKIGFIRYIFSNNDSRVWVGTDAGIWLITRTSDTIEITHLKSLRTQKVSAFLEKGDSLWVGTLDNGLWCLNKNNFDTLDLLSTKDGLKDNVVYGILSDHKSNIWFSSNHGITCYNPRVKTFNQYGLSNGLRIDEHNNGAFAIYRNNIFFGGTKGINSFSPDIIDMSGKNVAFKKFLLLDNTDNSNARESIIHIGKDEIQVDPFQDSSRFYLRITEFSDPTNNKYKYCINNSDWSSEKSTSEPLYIPRNKISSSWLFRHKSLLVIAIRSSNGLWDTLQPVSIYKKFNLAAEYKFAFKRVLTYTIGGVLLFLLILCLVYLRNKRIRREKRAAEERATAAIRRQLIQEIENQKNILTLDRRQREAEDAASKSKISELESQQKLIVADKEREDAENRLKIKDLESQAQKLANEKLQSERDKVDSLKNLQELINEITKCGDIATLISTALNHLIRNSIFDFDYAIFSNVNYGSGIINVRHSDYKENRGVTNPQTWRTEFDPEKLDSRDVVTITAKEDLILKVVGPDIFIDGVKANDRVVLHSEIYNRFGHKHLIRLFVPVKYRGTYDHSKLVSDRVLALFEVGFNKANVSDIKVEQEERLKLYIDNFAQVYTSLLHKEKEDVIEEILSKSYRDSGDDPNLYLQNVFTNSCEATEVQKGLIVILSGNHSRISQEEIIENYHIGDEKEQWEVIYQCHRLFSKAIKTKAYSISNDAPQINSAFWNNWCALVVPIVFKEVVIACLVVLSDKQDFKNSGIINFFCKVFNSVAEVFLGKKFHSAIRKLTIPENVLSNPYENFNPILESLQSYFFTNYVSVWLRDDDQPGYSFKQIKATKRLQKIYDGKQIAVFSDVKIENSVIVLDTAEPIYENQFFWNFAKKLGLKALINVPLIRDTGQYGFINIYSKRGFNSDLLKEMDDKFLNIISSKATFSYLCSKMIHSFSEISQSIFVENTNSILKKITSHALEILHSDPVILFQFDEQEHVIYEETIYSGHLKNKAKLYEKSKANFIETSVEERKERFVTSETDLPEKYQRLISSSNNKDDNFWTREDIRSLVSIPLKSAGKLIGIMCFNYRHRQTFPEPTRQLIKSFSSLAEVAMNNANLISEIKTHLNKITIQERKSVIEKNRLSATEFVLSESIKNEQTINNILITFIKSVLDTIKCDVGLIAYLSKTNYYFSDYVCISGEKILKSVDEQDLRNFIEEVISGARDVRLDNVDKISEIFETTIGGNIAIPLRYENQIIGVFFAGRMSSQDLDPNDIDYLQQLSSKVTQIIQNKKFYDANRLLNEFSFEYSDNLISDFKSREESICTHVAALVNNIIETPLCCIWLIGKEKQEKVSDDEDIEYLYLAGVDGVSPDEIKNKKLQQNQGISWNLIREFRKNESGDHVRYINNINSKNSKFSDIGFALKNNLMHMNCIAITYDKRVLGVMNVFSSVNINLSNYEITILNNTNIRLGAVLTNNNLHNKNAEQLEKWTETNVIANPGIVALSFVHDMTHLLQSLISDLGLMLIFWKQIPKNAVQTTLRNSIEEKIISSSQQSDAVRKSFMTLINIGKRVETEFKTVSIRDIIDTISHLFNTRFSTNKIDFSFSMKEKDIKFSCKVNEIEQVFVNLMLNSIAALDEVTHRRRTVSISAEKVVRRDIDYIKICFTDNGTGIHESHMKKIYDINFTSKKKEGGSGFGLTICRTIIEQNHNGELKHISTFGDGTTFFIHLPIIQKAIK